jgi:hypothetical protein
MDLSNFVMNTRDLTHAANAGKSVQMLMQEKDYGVDCLQDLISGSIYIRCSIMLITQFLFVLCLQAIIGLLLPKTMMIYLQLDAQCLFPQELEKTWRLTLDVYLRGTLLLKGLIEGY